MTYPKYEGSIRPFSLAGIDLSDSKKAESAYNAVCEYLRDNTYIFTSHVEEIREINQFDVQIVGSTSDSIIVNVGVLVESPSKFSAIRVPLPSWDIKLFSFQTPVDKVKHDLERTIREAAAKP